MSDVGFLRRGELAGCHVSQHRARAHNMLHLLAIGATATTVPRDLALPFPRPTAAQAVAQLASAVEATVGGSEPEDALDAYGGRSEWLAGFEAEVAS